MTSMLHMFLLDSLCTTQIFSYTHCGYVLSCFFFCWQALQTIDAEIATSLDFRRKQREGAGSAYFDAGTYAQGPFARVPEALRPKPGRLSIAQQRVYEVDVLCWNHCTLG